MKLVAILKYFSGLSLVELRKSTEKPREEKGLLG
jgi:hypothetical protein